MVTVVSFFSFLNNALALRTEFPKRFSTSEVTILAQTRSTWSGGTWTNHFPDVMSMLEEKPNHEKEVIHSKVTLYAVQFIFIALIFKG